jgi:hypothetical protein
MTGLRLLSSIFVGFCLFTTGCGPDSLSGDNSVFVCPGELPAGPICEAFCERVVVDCNAFNAITKESCIQGCECDLQETREISDECGEAQENGFLCTSELDCQGVFDFFSQALPDDSPCRGAVADVIAACEG